MNKPRVICSIAPIHGLMRVRYPVRGGECEAMFYVPNEVGRIDFVFHPKPRPKNNRGREIREMLRKDSSPVKALNFDRMRIWGR